MVADVLPQQALRVGCCRPNDRRDDALYCYATQTAEVNRAFAPPQRENKRG